MAVIIPQVVTEDRASGAQVVDGSLRFDDTSDNRLERTVTIGNRRTFTFSCWVKRGVINATPINIFAAGSNNFRIALGAGDGYLQVYNYNGSSHDFIKGSSAMYRDTGWYHLVVAIDTTNGTADDRMKLYVNGERLTAFGNGNTNPSSSFESYVNDPRNTHYLGYIGASGYDLDAYLSQAYFIDGQALDASYFGFTDPLTNTWRPKKYNVSKADTVLVGSPTYATSDFKTSGNKTSNQTGLSFGSWTSGSYTGAETKIFKNSTDTAFTLNIGLVGGTTDRLLWYSDNLTDWTFVGNTNPDRYYRLTGHKYYATSEGSGSTTLHATADGHNSFYLPMDGNSPIGQDQSENGNNWTPVNFGGSADITKATGALPILNTGNGGTAGRPGVLGSEVSKYYTILGTSGGGNPYVFEDLGNQPQLSFIRGATYTFDWSAASSHPLRFATAADAAGSTEYTDGTDVTGNVTTITVPHNAPDTLYYYCNVHGGMGNSISVTTDTKKADPYAWKSVIAMPLNSNEDYSGIINCTQTSQTVTNSSTTFAEVTNFYGSTASFSRSSANYLSVPDSAGIELGSDDFTIEFWLYLNNTTSQYEGIISKPGNGDAQAAPIIYKETNGTININFSEAGSSNWNIGQNIGNCAQLAFKWHHVAITREGSTFRFFLDGVFVKTQTSANALYDNGNPLYIGKYTQFPGSVTYGFDGYLQDFRLYKGVAKYTSTTIGDQAFIPASSNPDILPDTPSGVGTKTQLTKITDGAVSFSNDDTVTDYLSVSNSTDFQFGSGDFTVEFYANIQNPNGIRGLVGVWGYANDRRSWNIQTFTGAEGAEIRGYISTDGTNTTNFNTAAICPQGVWTHVAFTREGTNIKLYINGKLQDTTAIGSGSIYTNGQDPLLIGGISETAYGLTGQVSNLRVIKGTALYTSDFTPPTRALTNVTNTKLLCCQSNTSATAAAVAPNLDTYTVRDNNGGTYWSGATLSDATLLSNLFDGDNSTSCQQSTNGVAASITNFGPVNVSNTVSFYSPDGDARYTLNGGSEVSVSGTGWHDISFSGTLTSFTFQAPGSSRIFIYGMKIDGVELVDIITPGGSAAATTFNPLTTDINTVRGQEGAYATLNPLISTVSLSDGNLKQAQTSGTWNVAVSSIPMSTGKWYCEATLVGGNTFQIGIIKVDAGPNWVANFPLVDFPYGWGMIRDGAAKLRSDYITQLNGRTDVEYNPAPPADGDTIGMAYDADIQALTFYVNGISYGDTTSYWVYPPTPGEYVFGNSVVSGTDAVWNFGQKPLKFPPPDGFQPLTSSTVRPDTVIARPDQYFDVSLWTGNGTSQTITGLKHKPDLVWTKARSFGADPEVYDSVRGTMKRLYSSLTTQEGTASSGVNSFNADGFGVTGGGGVNNNTSTYVGWSWKAGGNKNTFNVDDVGYANASDVNMSVGSLNSSIYNQGSTNYTTSQVTGSDYNQGSGNTFGRTNGMFDGQRTTIRSASAQTTFTWTTSIALTTLRLMVHKEGGTTTINITDSNGTRDIASLFPTTTNNNVSNGNLTFVNVPVSGTLTKIEVNADPSGVGYQAGIAMVEVDGKILVDNGVTLPDVPSIAATGSSVGTKQGFSIIKYTGSNSGGSTLAHGLGQTPDFVMCKNLGTSYNWFIWHNEFGNGTNAAIYFTDAAKTTGYVTQPFASFTKHSIILNNSDGVNGNYNYIMYAWHNVPGFQKFGSYESNSNGVFVELGFRPALLVVKNVDATLTNSQWNVVDTQRDTYNPSLNNLAWNRSNSEPAVSASTYGIDIHSNGFHIPSGNTGEAINNTSATQTYIYAAWAEAPSFNLYGATSNAR